MLEIAIEARKASIAPGMEVREYSFRLKRMVGPFIFMDHAWPGGLTPARVNITGCFAASPYWFIYCKLFVWRTGNSSR